MAYWFILDGCHDTVGDVAAPQTNASQIKPCPSHNLFGSYVQPSSKNKRMPRVTPNHSLNRTHCGMRLKARHFILGL